MGRKGSGYVIAPGLVLTAGHVVAAATGPCEVQSLSSADWHVASRVWLGGECDAALLAVDLGDDGVAAQDLVGLGRLVTGRRAGCEGIGFPWAQLSRDERGPRRHTERIVGMVDRLTGIVPGEGSAVVALHVDGGVPEPRGDGNSPWEGMSGAALFAGELLIALVILDPARFGSDRLGAVLISAVATDLELGEVLRETGFSSVLRAVEAVSVTSGRLLRPRRSAGAVSGSPSVSRLLRAESAVVGFRGRERELADLERWCLSTPGLAVGVVVASGGSGKTRLAGELCERVERGGGVAGFVLPGVGRERVAGLVGAAALLLVIDDANTRPIDMREAISGLSAAASSAPLRVLLLARGREAWWSRLRADLESDQDALDAIDESLMLELGAVDESLDGRGEAFRQAAAAFAGELGDGLGEWPDLDLSGPMFSAILFIHLAALSAVMGERTRLTGTVLRADLIDFALEREARYWTATAASQGVQLDHVALQRAVALASLTSAADEDQAARTLALVPDLADNPAQLRPCARWLRGLYPPSIAYTPGSQPPWFRPLTPDRIGEALIARVVAEIPSLLPRLLASCSSAQAQVALTSLAQTAHAHPGVAEPLRAALIESPDPALAGIVAANVPQHTTALREVAALATERQLQATRQQSPSAERDVDLARLNNSLGVRLSDLGRREEALAAIEEAVQAYRGLAGACPDAFLPALARSLHNQSNRLGDLGRREEALAAIEEAVRIRRRLAGARPDAFLPDLARSLNNQSLMLGELGRWEEALAAIEEAVQAYRGLAGARRDAFLPDLARSLNDQSNSLSELGRRGEALAAIEEAVRIRRGLADARPAVFLPDLARSLNNQSNRLSELGRSEEALNVSREALSQILTLFERTPCFLPDTALMLKETYLKRHEEAGDEPDWDTLRRIDAALTASQSNSSSS